MTTPVRLKAKTIRGAQKEVKAHYPQGGTIDGWYSPEDLKSEDVRVYQSKIFKREKSLFRRKTLTNSKQTKPEYFTFEPFQESGE